MKIGAMINPYADPYKELEWVGKNGFDFVDFTVEPEQCMPDQIDVRKAKRIMKKYGLGIVGHMGDWRLPKSSDYKSLRESSEKEMLDAMRILKRLGAKKITMHMPTEEHFDIQKFYNRYFKLINRLLKEAKSLNVVLMIENDSTTREQKVLLDRLMKRFPKLMLHVDVGHANLRVRRNITPYYLSKYSKRFVHIHFSDNYGKNDNHKQLGGGNISWKSIIKLLKRYKYDDTITLETFRSGKQGILYSKSKLERWWKVY